MDRPAFKQVSIEQAAKTVGDVCGADGLEGLINNAGGGASMSFTDGDVRLKAVHLNVPTEPMQRKAAASARSCSASSCTGCVYISPDWRAPSHDAPSFATCRHSCPQWLSTTRARWMSPRPCSRSFQRPGVSKSSWKHHHQHCPHCPPAHLPEHLCGYMW